MKKLLREPLLHFLLLGVVIFVIYDRVTPPGSDEPGTIVISQGQISSMMEGFTRTWQRPPTREELDGLIRDRVREEVYCREATALGMDKDDMVIRRRLRQKMEFVSDDVVARAEPSDADLNAYLQAHPEAFRMEQKFTFLQVYLNPEKHKETLAHDAALLLTQLRQAVEKSDVSALGDSFLLEHEFAAVPAGETTKQFGEAFTAKLGTLATGQWQGPVESGYGSHLVLITGRTEGRVPALTEVHDAVAREWANARRLDANEKFYAELLKRYTVTVESMPPTEKQNGVATTK